MIRKLAKTQHRRRAILFILASVATFLCIMALYSSVFLTILTNWHHRGTFLFYQARLYHLITLDIPDYSGFAVILFGALLTGILVLCYKWPPWYLTTIFAYLIFLLLFFFFMVGLDFEYFI